MAAQGREAGMSCDHRERWVFYRLVGILMAWFLAVFSKHLYVCVCVCLVFDGLDLSMAIICSVWTFNSDPRSRSHGNCELSSSTASSSIISGARTRGRPFGGILGYNRRKR